MEQTKDNLTPQEQTQTLSEPTAEVPQEQTQTVSPEVDQTTIQIQELQRKLTEMANENAALTQRFNEIGYQQQQQTQAHTSQQFDEDYAMAMQKFAEGDNDEGNKYLQRARQKEQMNIMQNVSRIVDTNYLLRQKEEQVLREKPYLRPVQMQMEQRFYQLAQQGIPYEKALEQTVGEFDTSFQIAAKQFQPQNNPPQPPPAGSQGVTSQSPPQAIPQEPAPMTDQEWVQKRQADNRYL